MAQIAAVGWRCQALQIRLQMSKGIPPQMIAQMGSPEARTIPERPGDQHTAEADEPKQQRIFNKLSHTENLSDCA
jgi:hypothetical protein